MSVHLSLVLGFRPVWVTHNPPTKRATSLRIRYSRITLQQADGRTCANDHLRQIVIFQNRKILWLAHGLPRTRAGARFFPPPPRFGLARIPRRISLLGGCRQRVPHARVRNGFTYPIDMYGFSDFVRMSIYHARVRHLGLWCTQYDGQARHQVLVNIDAFSALRDLDTLKTSKPGVRLQLHMLGLGFVGQIGRPKDGSARLALPQYLHEMVAILLALRAFEGAIEPIVSNAAGFCCFGSTPTLVYHEADSGFHGTAYAGLAWAFRWFGESNGGHGCKVMLAGCWSQRTVFRCLVVEMMRARGCGAVWRSPTGLSTHPAFAQAMCLMLLGRAEHMREALCYLITARMQRL